jgi:hypothetical protein
MISIFIGVIREKGSDSALKSRLEGCGQDLITAFELSSFEPFFHETVPLNAIVLGSPVGQQYLSRLF